MTIIIQGTGFLMWRESKWTAISSFATFEVLLVEIVQKIVVSGPSYYILIEVDGNCQDTMFSWN